MGQIKITRGQSFDRRGDVYPMVRKVKKFMVGFSFTAAGVTVFY